MQSRGQKANSDEGQVKQGLRWDIVGFLLAFVIAVVLIFLLDTGSLTEWIAKHKQSKVDEVIVASIILLVALSFFSIRRWLGLSSRLIKYEKSREHEHLSEADQLKKTQRRDLIGLSFALAIAIILVLLFDTGALAEWISKHKETKVDEIIVVAIILLVGLSFFCVRRWLELSQQVVKYEELYRRTRKLSRESALLGELSELLQSCLSSDEANHLITDRAQILFPGISGALCVTASSRDLVEVIATWGDPALAEQHFAPKDCWALRRGRVHVLADDPSVLSCAHLGKTRPRRSMCVPMMAHGEALGLLYLDTGRNDRKQIEQSTAQLSESEQQLARTFAEQTALALAKAGDSVLRMLGNLFRTQFRGEDVV